MARSFLSSQAQIERAKYEESLKLVKYQDVELVKDEMYAILRFFLIKIVESLIRFKIQDLTKRRKVGVS